MQTPPTNDAAARATAVKARWKRAVHAVQEPLTPSVAEAVPPRPQGRVLESMHTLLKITQTLIKHTLGHH